MTKPFIHVQDWYVRSGYKDISDLIDFEISEDVTFKPNGFDGFIIHIIPINFLYELVPENFYQGKPIIFYQKHVQDGKILELSNVYVGIKKGEIRELVEKLFGYK